MYTNSATTYGGVRKTTYPKATKLAWITEAAKSETGKPNWKANRKARPRPGPRPRPRSREKVNELAPEP